MVGKATQTPAAEGAARLEYAAPTAPLDLLSIFRILSAYRSLMIGFTVLGLVLGVAAAVLMTPVYRASVLIAPVEGDELNEGLSSLAGQLGGLASIAGIRTGGDPTVDQNLAVLRSRDFAMNFAQDEGLVPVLYEDDWDEATADWRPDEGPPSPGEVWEKLDEDVRKVSVDRGTGLVTLSVDWTDPELSATWANLLVTRANEKLRARAIDEAERSLAYLNRELEKATIVELRQAIYRLVEQQVNKIMLANVREEFAFTVLDPAVPPDADDFVRPNRPVLVILGLAVGLLLGGMGAILLHLLREGR